MKLLLLLVFVVSCQDYNSNSGDRGKYGPVILNESDPNYAEAYAIIQNRCVNCHRGYHDHWANFTSNDDWIGLVEPNDPDNSSFIQRIINSGQTNSNMPEGGSALPTAEYNHLRKWVSEFQ